MDKKKIEKVISGLTIDETKGLREIINDPEEEANTILFYLDAAFLDKLIEHDSKNLVEELVQKAVEKLPATDHDILRRSINKSHIGDAKDWALNGINSVVEGPKDE